MPDLTQPFACDVALADAKRNHRARIPRQAGGADEIRPPRPEERMAAHRSRDSLCAVIAAIASAAAIALSAILSSYVSRNAQPNRQTIEAIDVKDLVEGDLKAESRGLANKKSTLSSATGAGQFLDDTWLEAVRKHR